VSAVERLFGADAYAVASGGSRKRAPVLGAPAPLSAPVPTPVVAEPRSGLDTKGATFPPVETKGVSRWRLKHQISRLIRAGTAPGAPVPGVCKCGTARHDTTAVSVVRRDGRAGFRGTLACDSSWLCPTCAPRRAGQRVERLEGVFDAVEAKGWMMVFVTLTAAHGPRDALEDLKRLVSDASRSARQGRAWMSLAATHGVEGTIVGPEVTWSARHGWHYHQHLAVIVSTSDPEAAERAGHALLARYLAEIRKAGGRALPQGQDVQAVWRREDLKAYLAKGSAAWEVGAAGTGKVAHGRGSTPFDLAAAGAAGDRRAAALFLAYSLVMPGTRSCVVTASIAAKLGIAEADDAETEGEVQDEPADEEIGLIDRADWHVLLRRGHVPDVLAAVQAGVPWPFVCRSILDWIGVRKPPDPG